MNDKNLMRIIVGGVVILFGISILLSKFLSISFSLFSLWPLIFIGAGVSQIVYKRYTLGIILSVFGVLSILSSILHFNFWIIIWPCLIIAFGISIIFKDEKSSVNSTNGEEVADKASDLAVFWGIDKKYISKSFRGGSISAIFGGIKVDLSSVVYARNSKIDVSAIFGGVEVFVKKGTNVKVNGFGMFGGVENSVKNNEKKTIDLIINANAVFGGVTIKEF